MTNSWRWAEGTQRCSTCKLPGSPTRRNRPVADGVLADRPNFTRTLRGIGLMIATSFRAAPWLAAGTFGFTAVGAIVTPLGSLFLKQITNELVQGDKGGV